MIQYLLSVYEIKKKAQVIIFTVVSFINKPFFIHDELLPTQKGV